MRAAVRRAGTALLASAVLCSPAAAAHAQRIENVDRSGDVVRFATSDGAAVVPRPGIVHGDVLRTRLAYTADHVVVRLTMARLKRKGGGFGVYVRIRTDDGTRRYVQLVATPGDRAGNDVHLYRPRGSIVDCSLRHHLHYAGAVARISVPSSCLGDPRWVRLGVIVAWSSADNERVYGDDALIDGDALPDGVKLSARRIHRG